MARPEITGKKIAATGVTIGRKIHHEDDVDDADAYSVEEFCRRHRISVQLFYKFRDQMPGAFRVGTKVLISREAAARWRKEREEAAKSAEAEV